MYTGASVFDRLQKFQAWFGRAGEPTIWRQNNRAQKKRCGPTRVRVLNITCINALVMCGPRQEWKPLRMDWWGSIASRRDWLFRPRLPEMESEKHSHFPFSVSIVHWLYRWARAHKACPLSVDQSPCMSTRRARRSRGFDQRSVGISDRSVVRSEIVDANPAESSERSRDAASWFLSFSCWKWRDFTNFLVETNSLIHSFKKNFQLLLMGIFFFSQSFKEDNQAVFLLGEKRFLSRAEMDPDYNESES